LALISSSNTLQQDIQLFYYITASLFSLFPPKFGTPPSSTDLDNGCRQFSLAYAANTDIQEKNLGPTILLCLMDDEKSKWLSGNFDMETVKVEEMLTVLRQQC
jgi:hypothetical protein